MSKRTREAERQFGDALRAHTAFQVKATPDYKALAHARKVERRYQGFGFAMGMFMIAISIGISLGVI